MCRQAISPDFRIRPLGHDARREPNEEHQAVVAVDDIYLKQPVPYLFRQNRKTSGRRPPVPTAVAQVKPVTGNIGAAQLHPHLTTPRSTKAPTRSSAW